MESNSTSSKSEAPSRIELPQGDPHHAAVVTQNSAIVAPIPQADVAAGKLAPIILTIIATVFALEMAQSFIIPVLLGVLFAYTLNPLVVWLEIIKIPRLVATSLVMASLVCALIFGAYSLGGQTETIIAQLPVAASKLSAALTSAGGPFSNMQKMQSAANTIEKAARETTNSSKQLSTPFVIDQTTFKLTDLLWKGSMGAAGAIAQAITVLFLVFFLLSSGNTFKRKLVRLTGPSLSNKKVTVHLLEDINKSIQRYMFMLLITNMEVTLLTWIAFRWVGLDNAGGWAVGAGLLHIIPYFGPMLIAAVSGMAAFLQFDTFSTAFLVAALSLVIATFVGTFVTTWMAGKIASMNNAAVFISLLFWGWLWGIWGMLLSIPITVIVKVVSERIEQLHVVAELLSEERTN